MTLLLEDKVFFLLTYINIKALFQARKYIFDSLGSSFLENTVLDLEGIKQLMFALMEDFPRDFFRSEAFSMIHFIHQSFCSYLRRLFRPIMLLKVLRTVQEDEQCPHSLYGSRKILRKFIFLSFQLEDGNFYLLIFICQISYF